MPVPRHPHLPETKQHGIPDKKNGCPPSFPDRKTESETIPDADTAYDEPASWLRNDRGENFPGHG